MRVFTILLHCRHVELSADSNTNTMKTECVTNSNRKEIENGRFKWCTHILSYLSLQQTNMMFWVSFERNMWTSMGIYFKDKCLQMIYSIRFESTDSSIHFQWLCTNLDLKREVSQIKSMDKSVTWNQIPRFLSVYSLKSKSMHEFGSIVFNSNVYQVIELECMYLIIQNIHLLWMWRFIDSGKV